jgi:signal recognition particle GTPase
VQKLVKQFAEMQKMMRQMGGGKGGVPKRMPRMPFKTR